MRNKSEYSNRKKEKGKISNKIKSKSSKEKKCFKDSLFCPFKIHKGIQSKNGP